MNSDFLAKLISQYDQLKYSLLEAQTFNPKHFGFSPTYYQIMESDQQRVGAFRKAFAKYNFKDKIICEAGIGRLALSQYFLPQVKKAYLIENNPDLQEDIVKKLKENAWSDKVELIFGDARTITLPEPVDFIIGELMSIYCGNEYQVQIFQHLRQFLKADGKLLPEKITNIAQLAYASFEKEHLHYSINFSRHLPELLSLQVVVNTINLYEEKRLLVEKIIPIIPILSGKINAVYMRSFVQIAEGCNFTGTDSLMPPTVCQLREECEVKEGEEVQLHCRFAYGTSLEEADFWIE